MIFFNLIFFFYFQDLFLSQRQTEISCSLQCKNIPANMVSDLHRFFDNLFLFLISISLYLQPLELINSSKYMLKEKAKFCSQVKDHLSICHILTILTLLLSLGEFLAYSCSQLLNNINQTNKNIGDRDNYRKHVSDLMNHTLQTENRQTDNCKVNLIM